MYANEIIRMGDHSLKQNPTKVRDFYSSYLLDQSVILTTIISINYTGTYTFGSQYSDSLKAGQSGDRNLVGARFSALVQTIPGAHPASYTMGAGYFLHQD
jgi:hypothetical protein